MTKRVAETYAKDSNASSKTALSDPYVKFFRWATDRLQNRDGIVTFVSNNGFLPGIAFDGFRKHLMSDFSSVYHFDFKGNARTTGERRRKEGGNIFHDLIRCGVGITVLVRSQASPAKTINYHAVEDYWKAEEKARYLRSFTSLNSVPWSRLTPDYKYNWLVPDHAEEFNALVPIGSKTAKSGAWDTAETIFKVFSGGVATCRDDVAYDFDKQTLSDRVRRFIDDFNGEVDRYKRSGGKQPVDEFVRYDKIKWSRDLKFDLQRGNYATFEDAKVRNAQYRPFCRRWLFFDRILNEEVYVNPSIFPKPAAEMENLIIWAKAGMNWPFFVLVSAHLVDLLPQSGSQCFPFYVYDEDGTNRRENITDWALEHFREHCNDKKITKWDIFYYVYGVLHHPEYRSKYAENLKRELPRIPLAKDFWGFSKAGKELAGLHIEYEKLEPWPLKFIETTGVAPGLSPARAARMGGGAVAAVSDRRPAVGTPPLQKAERRSALQSADLKVGATILLSYRVEDKMRLAKDRRSLKINDSLTLGGIPPEAFEYRLGNRSALEWVIDQYQVTEDKHSGIRSDPNRPDDPEYIVRLAGQVVRVSVETVKLVKSLPAL